MATAEIDQAIVELLKNVLPGGGDVYGGIAPANQRSPFITFQRVFGTKIRAINGPSGLAQATYQIDVYSDDYAESRSLAKAVRIILDGFSGTVTIGADSIRIGGCSMTNERDFTEDKPNPKLYRASVDYLFTFDEDI